MLERAPGDGYQDAAGLASGSIKHPPPFLRLSRQTFNRLRASPQNEIYKMRTERPTPRFSANTG